MSEPTTYTGGCHCGAVRFRVTDLKLEAAAVCNCSICTKTGAMLALVPGPQFELLSGQDALSDYQFGKKRIHHLFCSRCGIKPFGRGKGPNDVEMVAVNIRCFDDIDLAAIPTRSFDGKSIPVDT